LGCGRRARPGKANRPGPRADRASRFHTSRRWGAGGLVIFLDVFCLGKPGSASTRRQSPRLTAARHCSGEDRAGQHASVNTSCGVLADYPDASGGALEDMAWARPSPRRRCRTSTLECLDYSLAARPSHCFRRVQHSAACGWTTARAFRPWSAGLYHLPHHPVAVARSAWRTCEAWIALRGNGSSDRRPNRIRIDCC
jgi:hypothetical protein